MMKIGIQSRWSKLILIFLLSLVCLLWFKPGYLITGTDVDFPLFPEERLVERAYTWYPQILGGTDRSNNTASLPYVFPQAFLSSLGFNIIAVEKITYVFWFFLSGISFYFLMSVVLPNKSLETYLSRFFGVAIYMFNFYNVFLWLRLQSSITTLVLFPAFLGLVIGVFEEKISISRAVLTLFLVSIIGGPIGVQTPLIFILFLMLSLYVLYYFVINRRAGINPFLTRLKYFFILVLVFSLSSAYWVIPLSSFITQAGYWKTEVGKSVYSVDFLLGWVSSITSFLNVFRLYGDVPWFDSWGGERYFPEFKLFQENLILILLSFALPILVFYSVLLIKRKKERLLGYFAFLVILGLFLSKGSHSPFGKVYYWLIDNFPLFWIQRAPWQKFTIMTIIGYSVLGGFGLGKLYNYLYFKLRTNREIKRLFNKNNYTFAFSITVIAFILGFNYLFVFGKMFSSKEGEIGYHEKYNLGFHQKFPNYLFQARDWVNSQKDSFRLLLLPDLNTNVYDWGYGGSGDISSLLFNRGTLYRQYGEGFAPPSSIESVYETVIDSIYTTEIRDVSKILGLLNIKYILQRNDFRYDFYGDLDSPAFIKEKLSAQENIQLKNSFGKWDFYKIDDKYFLPHFYVPQKTIYAIGGRESLESIAGLDNDEIRPEIYLEDSTLGNSEILARADAVYLNLSPEKGIGEDYLEKYESFREQVPFPYVKHQPGSLFYSLVLKKEWFDEWRAKGNTEKLIEKKLFYAGKRISELEKFGGIVGEELITQIAGSYLAKMEEVIDLVEGMAIENEQARAMKEEMGIMLGAYWERHKEKLLELTSNVVGQLDRKIDTSRNKLDLQSLEYNFQVPKDETYEIFVKSRAGEEIKDWAIELDGDELSLKNVETRGDGWLSLGRRYLKNGIHKLVLHISEPVNLAGGNWQRVKELEIKGSGISYFPNAQNFVFQEINQWLANGLYYLSFNYSVEGENWKVGILEEGTEYLSEEKAVKTNLVFEEELESGERKQLEGRYKFETLVRAGANSLGAKICFYTQGKTNQLDKLNVEDLVIVQLVEPRIVFKSIGFQPRETRQLPEIQFVRVNPTKYKVKIEGAKEPYTLVFSESFHQGWKAYVENTPDIYGEVVASYFDGEVKEGTHQNIFLDRDTFETWNKRPIPEERHLLVNGYANSWYITPEDSRRKENYEIIIEFWPQRLFYIGLFVSSITLIGCLFYLTYDIVKNKKVARNS